MVCPLYENGLSIGVHVLLRDHVNPTRTVYQLQPFSLMLTCRHGTCMQYYVLHMFTEGQLHLQLLHNMQSSMSGVYRDGILTDDVRT